MQAKGSSCIIKKYSKKLRTHKQNRECNSTNQKRSDSSKRYANCNKKAKKESSSSRNSKPTWLHLKIKDEITLKMGTSRSLKKCLQLSTTKNTRKPKNSICRAKTSIKS